MSSPKDNICIMYADITVTSIQNEKMQLKILEVHKREITVSNLSSCFKKNETALYNQLSRGINVQEKEDSAN